MGSGPNREESVESQCHDHFVNLEQRRDREVSVHTTHTSRSQSWTGSHVSHGENTRNLQPEIDHLRRKLCRKQRRESPSSSGSSSDGDSNYRPRSRTPPSESFSYNEEHCHKWRSRSPTYRGLGNDAISKALRQISKSLFTQKIERVKLPRQFTQSTFTMYNGRTDLVEHVSHFNQMRHWCVTYFHPVWGPWQWDGLMGWRRALLTPFKSLPKPLELDLSRVAGFLALWIPCYQWQWRKGKL